MLKIGKTPSYEYMYVTKLFFISKNMHNKVVGRYAILFKLFLEFAEEKISLGQDRRALKQLEL